MPRLNEQPWVEAGYEAFALHGPDALRVEQLARQVGISKSSFYHQFADIPIFVERLLGHHQQRADLIAEVARSCRSFNPDYLRVLVDHRTDMLFQRQLRMHRDNMAYQYCYQRAHSTVVEEVMPLWAQTVGLPGQLPAAREMLDVVTDVFYQRLTNDNLNMAFATGLLKEIEVFIRHALKRGGMGAIDLNGPLSPTEP